MLGVKDLNKADKPVFEESKGHYCLKIFISLKMVYVIFKKKRFLTHFKSIFEINFANCVDAMIPVLVNIVYVEKGNLERGECFSKLVVFECSIFLNYQTYGICVLI